MVWFNLTNPQLTLPVRQAMAYAINRAQVSTTGEYGYEPASNQTDIVQPTFSSWYDSSAAAQYGNAYAYDPTKAIQILTAAGYTRGSNGIFAKNGHSLSFTIINNGGFSDWVASVQVLQSELRAVGIAVTPDNLSNTTFDSDIYTGNYQLAYDWDSGGPTPYYELRAILYSPNSAPVGKTAATNWERYSNPSTDALIEQYAATTSPAVQHQVVDELQQVMLSDVPVIPVTEAVDWYQYDAGYPLADDPARRRLLRQPDFPVLHVLGPCPDAQLRHLDHHELRHPGNHNGAARPAVDGRAGRGHDHPRLHPRHADRPGQRVAAGHLAG